MSDIDVLEDKIDHMQAELDRLHALMDVRQQTLIERLRAIASALSIPEENPRAK